MKSTMTREEFISKVCDLWVEGFDLLQSKVSDTNPTEEKMKLLHASLKDKGKEYVTQWVKDYVLKHWNDDDIYSIIKWQTGEPKEKGEYLVQLKNGAFDIEECCLYEGYTTNYSAWSRYRNASVVAWCKLSDIEPYKDKED